MNRQSIIVSCIAASTRSLLSASEVGNLLPAVAKMGARLVKKTSEFVLGHRPHLSLLAKSASSPGQCEAVRNGRPSKKISSTSHTSFKVAGRRKS